ncbi:hypothetical protein [Nitratireductor luteus]|uniref:hypothetical protein n=1 Tax=Nitratireductor luteus TaxID=2976980 RepID=UPI00224062DD|nr:hypothetical protein [Nitratireductor luteus]
MHRYQDGIADDLRDQLSNLRDEITDLRRQVSRQSAGAYREASHKGAEFGDTMREYLEAAVPELRRGANHLGRTARRHPGASAGAAAAGLVVLGLAAALLMRR